MADQLGLVVLPLTVETPKGDFKNYLDWREIDAKTFYDNLRAGDMCKTSAVNTGTFQEAMEAILKEGKDVIYLAFSSGLSGTYNASMIAVNELTEAYPDRKVYSVDTLCASMGQGLIVYLAAQKKAEGASIDEVRDFVEANKMSVAHWVTVDDLQHLKRGGRISATTAIVGSMLKIKPIIHVDDNGKLVNIEKARGRKSALNTIIDKAAATAIEPAKQTMFISHGDCEADAQYVAAKLKEKLGVESIHINTIGPVIGAHAGPGTVAVFWLATER
jgi:DegV family protein with EDD domain